MEIRYHGHSCIQVTDAGISYIIDPFLSPNPNAPVKPEEVKVQYVLLTHGHSDHIADAVSIAKQNDATIIATHELATYLAWQGAKTFALNLGGSYEFEFGRVRMTHAFHSSAVILGDNQQIIYAGMPGGFIIQGKQTTLYHAGDTGLFGDMLDIGKRFNIDVAFLPIGDTFTMGPEDAVLAAEYVGARLVVPIHYNTFPVIQQDPEKFIAGLKAKGIEGRAMKLGETLSL